MKRDWWDTGGDSLHRVGAEWSCATPSRCICSCPSPRVLPCRNPGCGDARPPGRSPRSAVLSPSQWSPALHFWLLILRCHKLPEQKCPRHGLWSHLWNTEMKRVWMRKPGNKTLRKITASFWWCQDCVCVCALEGKLSEAGKQICLVDAEYLTTTTPVFIIAPDTKKIQNAEVKWLVSGEKLESLINCSSLKAS